MGWLIVGAVIIACLCFGLWVTKKAFYRLDKPIRFKDVIKAPLIPLLMIGAIICVLILTLIKQFISGVIRR